MFGRGHAAVWFFRACLVGLVLLVLLGPDPEQTTPMLRSGAHLAEDTGEAVTGSIPLRSGEDAPTGVLRTMWRNRNVLATLGSAAAALSAVRSARQVVLPLWGVSIGLDAQTI